MWNDAPGSVGHLWWLTGLGPSVVLAHAGGPLLMSGSAIESPPSSSQGRTECSWEKLNRADAERLQENRRTRSRAPSNGTGVTPRKDGAPSRACWAFGLEHEDVEQFAKCLGRNHDGVLGKRPDELEGLVTLLDTVDAFRIRKDVGVEHRGPRRAPRATNVRCRRQAGSAGARRALRERREQCGRPPSSGQSGRRLCCGSSLRRSCPSGPFVESPRIADWRPPPIPRCP
jgi:hypothetical protein